MLLVEQIGAGGRVDELLAATVGGDDFVFFAFLPPRHRDRLAGNGSELTETDEVSLVFASLVLLLLLVVVVVVLLRRLLLLPLATISCWLAGEPPPVEVEEGEARDAELEMDANAEEAVEEEEVEEELLSVALSAKGVLLLLEEEEKKDLKVDTAEAALLLLLVLVLRLLPLLLLSDFSVSLLLLLLLLLPLLSSWLSLAFMLSIMAVFVVVGCTVASKLVVVVVMGIKIRSQM